MSKLALKGGIPVKKEIGSYSAWPVGTEKMADKAVEILRSGVWNSPNNKTNEFATNYAKYCGTGYCIPVNSGTLALELILRGLEIGRGDEVIVPPYTFNATVAAVIMCGAMPVFADIDPGTYNISPEAVERVVTSKTRAVIGVHLGGRPVDADSLSTVAKKYKIHFIEDAAHAHGSAWDGRMAGSLGTAGAFSFQESKNLSCGEGGAITLNDESLYKKIWAIHNNGRDYDSGGFSYIGTNARMTEWQAMILSEGLGRLEADIDKRMENAEYLDKNIKRFPFLEPMNKNIRETRNSLHLYLFKYKKEGLGGIHRNTFIDAVSAENVCSVASGYSSPLYNFAMMYGAEFEKNTGRVFKNPAESMPNNELAAYEEGMWIYHSQLLGSKDDMDLILEAFEKISANMDELR